MSTLKNKTIKITGCIVIVYLTLLYVRDETMGRPSFAVLILIRGELSCVDVLKINQYHNT